MITFANLKVITIERVQSEREIEKMSECIASEMVVELAAKVVVLTKDNETLKASNDALSLQLAQTRFEDEFHVYTCVFKHDLRRLWPKLTSLTKELEKLKEEVVQKTTSAAELRKANNEVTVGDMALKMMSRKKDELCAEYDERVTKLEGEVKQLNDQLVKYRTLEEREKVFNPVRAFERFVAEQISPAKIQQLQMCSFDETQMEDSQHTLAELLDRSRQLIGSNSVGTEPPKAAGQSVTYEEDESPNELSILNSTARDPNTDIKITRFFLESE